MIYLLKPGEFERVRNLFRTINWHLAPWAILGNTAPGLVYVDDSAQPGSAVVQSGHRFYLAGSEANDEFNEGLKRLFLDQADPQRLEGGNLALVLYCSSEGWADEIEALLPKPAVRHQRQYYVFRRLCADWRSLIAPGFRLRMVDAELLREEGLANLDRLVREMLSECPTVGFFLDNRFGVCLEGGGELVGWCLSEYNWQDRCEVGIETLERHRHQGVATITASALVEQALFRGTVEIGWHCYADNEGSKATARKVGFERMQNYEVYVA